METGQGNSQSVEVGLNTNTTVIIIKLLFEQKLKIAPSYSHHTMGRFTLLVIPMETMQLLSAIIVTG